jgi:hypothetical protein
LTRLVFDDELFGAQLVRVVGTASYGASDVGECLAAARRVRGIDLDSWHDAWRTLADDTRSLAQQAEALGQRETAVSGSPKYPVRSAECRISPWLSLKLAVL